MKSLCLHLLLCCSFSTIFGQNVALIPAVNHQQSRKGEFKVNMLTSISFRDSDSLENERNYLQKLFQKSCKHNVLFSANNARVDNNIHLQINEEYLEYGQEAYSLDVDEKGVLIEGSTKTAVMRGIQTLRQLLPITFHKQEKRDSWSINNVSISDYSRTKHRGFLLDVCRHYFDAEVVKEYIDMLALYRMNVLHLHLTEDQGWRFASEKYPLLNTISSTRTELNGEKYGGIFTKEELREIVAYAAERHITVIPEIEMPGHSQAALAAYPHLSCTGEDVEVANDWGVFKEIYCAGNDSSFVFLKDILTEVMDIFPSKYIHIGGDEAPKQRWEQCDKCQKRIKTEDLKDEHELQSYFIGRIDQFLAEHGRSIIGWDEILEGGLSEGATVQSWRGFEGGIEAAKQQHQVIMSPTSHCYLDYGLSSIDIEKIYSFNPIPVEMDVEDIDYVIGAECNMWTEHVPDRKTLDKMVFPRIIAFSEALWIASTKPYYEGFYKRLQTHYPLLDAFGIQYGQEMIPVKMIDKFIDNKPHIELEHAMAEFSSMYIWRSENSLEEFENYVAPIQVDRSGTLVIQPLKDGKLYGEEISQSFVFHSGMNATTQYQTEINKWYTAGGESALVNGKTGSLDFRDGNWQGFWGEDVSIEFELNEEMKASSLSMNFYHYANAWIVQPEEVIFQTSKDGKKWSKPQTFSFERPTYDNIKKIVTANFNLTGKKAFKHLKVKCVNSGKMPENHDAAGEPSWIFIDEIIVK